MDLHEIITKDVARISPGDSLLEAAKVMKRRNISSILVVDNDVIVGILS